MHSTHNFKIRNKNFRIFDNNVNYQKQKRKENYMIINNIPEFLSDHQSCNHTPGVLPKCRRIIAIGDLHGDFQAMQQALIRAKIIDIDNNWIGEDSIVVQVGDVLDGGGRGHEIDSNGNNSLAEIQIFHFLYKLNVAARSSNGRVISLIGNHELMNMLGDFRYVSNSHKSGLGGDVKRKELFKPGGKLAKKIACNSLACVKIGDWIFIHGGILPEHIESLQQENISNNKNFSPITEINNLVRNILYGTINLDTIKPYQKKLLFGKNGLFWTREYSQGEFNDDDEKCHKITNTLKMLGVSGNNGGIVVGHTPQKTINDVCSKKIWRIDTGMSQAFGQKNNITDRIEILEIVNNGENFNVLR